MPAVNGAWNFYNDSMNRMGKAGFDFTNGHIYKVALFSAASICNNDAVATPTYTAFAADGHETAAGGGYSTGGVSVGAATWVDAAGVEQMTLANASWNTNGGGITFDVAVVYDDTDSNKRALAFLPAGVTVVANESPGLLVISLGLWFIFKKAFTQGV